MESIKVSIITPVYNASRFLDETAQSVLQQEYSNWEWILVDDCSKDDSKEKLTRLSESDDRIKVFFQNVNKGSGQARNLAINKASGKFIAFLDSDDLWRKDKLKKHVKFMLEKKAVFSHTSYGFIDEEGNKIKSVFRVSNIPVTYKMLLKRTEISCLTAMYDQEAIGKFYMPDIRRKQDYGLWLKILKEGYVSEPMDEELAFYRQVKGSATNNKLKLVIKHYHFMREIEKLSMFDSLKYTLFWGVNGFLKYYM